MESGYSEPGHKQRGDNLMPERDWGSFKARSSGPELVTLK